MTDLRQPTRTPETIQRYFEQGASVLARYERETGQTWQDDPMALADWLDVRRRGWRPMTWRRYRQGLKLHLEAEQAPQSLIDRLDEQRPGAPRLPASASGRPLKRVPRPVLEQYTARLERGRGAVDTLLSLFLSANIEIGLRPGEWAHARLRRDQLTVINEKTTNGRSNGPARRLIVRPTAQRLVRAAFNERDRLMSQGASWGELQRAMVLRLAAIRREGGLPHITLYSTRHQFAANAKSAGLTQRQVADLMGHASDQTAAAHYGRRVSGRGQIYVQFVAPESVPKSAPSQGARPSV